MKRQTRTQYLKLLGTLCLGVAALSARAGDQLFDFTLNPTNEFPSILIHGINEPNAWQSTGGNPGGYLQLTPAQGTENLVVVFPDIDGGYPVKAFKLTMDCRVGNGTARPADGFSISYCREGDPVLVNSTNGIAFGAAGGDDAATTLSPLGSGDLENGTKTGVAVIFDAWQGNMLPDTGALGVPGPDVEGIEVRVDDKTLKQIDMLAHRNGDCTYDAVALPDITVCQDSAKTNANSMQTGPYDGTLSTDLLGWEPLVVELNTNKQVTVTWKNVVMLDHYQLSQYTAHRGRLVLMGRCGGSYQNVNFDNIHLVTTPAVEATFGTLSSVGLDGFKVTIDDNGSSQTTNVSLVKLDGVDVTSKCTVTKVGPQTTVTYIQATNFLSGTTHTVDANWKTTLNQTLGATGMTFKVIGWTTLPESYAVTGVDLTQPGFIIQPYQTTAANPNRMYWTDEQLLGRHGTNELDLTGVAGVTNNNYVAWNDVIDFSNDAIPGANGQFFHDLAWYLVGIPAPGFANDDNSSMAVMAYAYFPTPGTYVFGGNSDDGIRLTFGPGSESIVGLEVPGMTADVGRGIGANQNSGGVVVTKAGYYGFRYLFENGGGGCNVELFTVSTPAGNVPLLVNDATNANSLKVYMVSTKAPPSVSDANPTMNNDTVWPNADLSYQITDSGTAVDKTKVTLTLDGVAQAPTVAKSGSVTTVTLLHSGGLWASASKHMVDLAYTDNLGTNYSVSYGFTVLNYLALPSNGVPLGKEDAAKPGFVMNIRAADPQSSGPGVGNMANRILSGEQMLAGLYGPNVATVANTTVTGTINFDIDTTANNGDFNPNNGFQDLAFPGIPSTSVAPLENFAAEYLTWVEFKTAGIYGMCVNSDDGFQTTSGLARPTDIGQITVNSPASIAGDKVAVFPDILANTPPALSPTNAITAKVVMYKDASGDNLGSATATNAAALAGNIALIQRGTSSFSVKCNNAQAAGAIAVIVGQNRPDNTPTDGRFPSVMGTGPTAGIPAVQTDLVTYQAMTNALASGDVMVTLHPEPDLNKALGYADYGKGAGQINFNIFVATPGLYPFRTLWWQGGGGGNCEWSTYDKTGTHILLNELTNTNALRTFQAVTQVVAPTMSIDKTGAVWKITYTGTLTSSGTASGTYTDVAGATSPYTVNTSTGSHFYRARN